jgi:hypothetical protein
MTVACQLIKIRSVALPAPFSAFDCACCSPSPFPSSCLKEFLHQLFWWTCRKDVIPEMCPGMEPNCLMTMSMWYHFVFKFPRSWCNEIHVSLKDEWIFPRNFYVFHPFHKFRHCRSEEEVGEWLLVAYKFGAEKLLYWRM